MPAGRARRSRLLERGHRARGERAGQQPAQPGVVRRVHVQHHPAHEAESPVARRVADLGGAEPGGEGAGSRSTRSTSRVPQHQPEARTGRASRAAPARRPRRPAPRRAAGATPPSGGRSRRWPGRTTARCRPRGPRSVTARPGTPRRSSAAPPASRTWRSARRWAALQRGVRVLRQERLLHDRGASAGSCSPDDHPTGTGWPCTSAEKSVPAQASR